MLLAIAEGEVIGQLGLIPCKITLQGEVFDAHWACDLMLNENFRGKGIAKKLYSEALNMRILLASDVSPSAAVSMARFGFNEMIGPHKLFYPFKLKSITDKKLKWATSIIGSWPNPFNFFSIVKRSGFELDNYKVPIQQIDLNFVKTKYNPEVGYVIHDHYNWRVGAFKDYQKEGEVFQLKDNFLAITRYSKTTGFIVEFIYKDFEIAKRVLIALVQRMKEMGLEELKFVTHDPAILSFLKKIGFIKKRTRVDTIYVGKDENFNSYVKPGVTLFDYTMIDCDENI